MEPLPSAFEEAFRAKRLAGRLHRADAVGRAENTVCGDVVEFDVCVEEGRIAQVRFRAAGCLAAIASAAYLAERALGSPAAEAQRLTAEVVERETGPLPSARRHGLLLALRALHAASGGHHLE